MDDGYILTLPPHAGLERLLSGYERLVYHIARRYFPSPEDAMDACQETALRLYKGLPAVKLPESGSLKSWVCRVTANTCVDMLRKKRPATEALAEYAHAAPSAEESAMANERVRTVMAAIHQLPEDHRRMIILRDMNGLTYQEIAEAVGVTEGTVKSRLSRARAALKKLC